MNASRALPARVQPKAALAVLLLLIATLSLSLGSRLTLVSGGVTSELGLHVERYGSSVNLAWNRAAKEIRNASQGSLFTRDGNGGWLKTPLTVASLRHGSVSYAPFSKSWECRLEVKGISGGTSAESIIVVAEPPYVTSSANVTLSASIPNAERRREVPEGRLAGLKKKTTTPPPFVAPPQPVSRNPVANPVAKNIVMPPLAPALATPIGTEKRPADAENVSDPVLGLIGAHIAIPKPTEAMTQPAPPLGIPAPAPRPALAIVTTEPKVIRKVSPRIPLDVRNLMTGSQEVDIRVKIDDNGRVLRATVASQNGSVSGLLVSSSLDAAKLWIFQPAKRGGRNIASEHVIEFVFSPSNP